jgi:hypothetical protein
MSETKFEEIRRIAREARSPARPRRKYVMVKPRAKRNPMTLEVIRAAFALDPAIGVKAGEGTIGSPTPRDVREMLSVRGGPLLTLKSRENLATNDNDTSPKWVRKLRAAYCDHFIKTGELDQEMAGKLRAYADACRQAGRTSQRAPTASKETFVR